MKSKILGLLLLGVVVFHSSESQAQTTGTQLFKVVVPARVSITAPANVTVAHSETDANQAFPGQTWLVKGNTLAGVTVSFSTNQPFTHTVDGSFKRNAQLALSVGSTLGPASWTVTQSSDVTDYAANDGVATVQAASNGVGRANMNLSVTFITDGFGSFAAGDYETTVTGTVTAN